jgi:imidazolonepropionase-like amidohydrolase
MTVTSRPPRSPRGASIIIPGLLPTILFIASVLSSCQAPGRSPALAFRDVRVFDGERTIPQATVIVKDGHIAAVGTDLAIPAGARVIEGEGRTLLPGLIDAHVHLEPNVLRRSLIFGVTTEISMGDDPKDVIGLQTAQLEHGAVDRADVFTSGWIVTPPGGHGAFPGSPTLARLEDADAFIKARVEDGADHIKIVYQVGSSEQQFRQPGMIPVFQEPVMRAAVEAAHRYGMVVAVHVNSLEAAKEVAEAGAEVLAHVFFDQVADEEIIRLLLENEMFVTTTFGIHESLFHDSEWKEPDDPRISPYLGPDEVGMLRSLGGRERRQWTNMLESVRVLHEAGVPILAGTDMPEISGLTMHRELETLVSVGLDPEHALIAATSAPADAFGLEDRGRIAPGARADLLLVVGDPTANISVTRDIVGVWKLGVEADRASYADEKQALWKAVVEPGELTIADFEGSEPIPTFGSLFEQATPGSSAETGLIDGGAVGSGRALAVSGEVVEAEGAFVNNPRWSGDRAGVAFRPTLRLNGGVLDLSAKSAITFWARGDGGTYRILVFVRPSGFTPTARTFVAGQEWAEFTFPFSSFEGVDFSELRGIQFAAGPEPGNFRFEIDGIRIH